jgi:molecular chaperone DnaK (HSP70)
MQKEKTTPSIIAFVEGGRLKEILQKTSGNKSYKTIASIKRFMGHSFAEFRLKQKSFFKVVKETTIHRVDIDGRLYCTRIVSNDTSKK